MAIRGTETCPLEELSTTCKCPRAACRTGREGTPQGAGYGSCSPRGYWHSCNPLYRGPVSWMSFNLCKDSRKDYTWFVKYTACIYWLMGTNMFATHWRGTAGTPATSQAGKCQPSLPGWTFILLRCHHLPLLPPPAGFTAFTCVILSEVLH